MNGTTLDWSEDKFKQNTSRISLGPSTFCPLHKLPQSAKDSKMYFFADETKVFRCILSKSDCDKLQQDINNMYDWTAHSLLTLRVGSPLRSAV